jgi:putative FmdB family regulatory protein
VPTYQYACTECSHAFEQFQSFHDDALTVCPACEGRLRKVFNAVGVVFKGSGFYRNDSRAGNGSDNGNGKGSDTPDASPAKAGAAGTSSPSDAGPSTASSGSGTPAAAGSSSPSSSSSSSSDSSAA